MESIFFEGGEIHLSEIACEQIFLEIPYQPLCREDCKGLCPQCGRDLNLSPCDCVREEWGSGFTALQKMKLDPSGGRVDRVFRQKGIFSWESQNAERHHHEEINGGAIKRLKPRPSRFAPQCHEPVLPHHVCPHCGAYKGKEVVAIEEEK